MPLPTRLELTLSSEFPKPLSALCCFTATTMSNQPEPTEPSSQNTIQTPQNYPVPLSPPLPPISKNLELSRAMSASSKSSLFALSRTHVVYEDEWLIAVNKPQGVYCESVLASVPQLLCGSTESDGRVSEGLVRFFLLFCVVDRAFSTRNLLCRRP